jgi:LysM repeat protein
VCSSDLEDIPSPDEGSGAAAPAPSAASEGAVKPLASSAAVDAAASVTGEKATASSGYTTEIDQDTTIEKLAVQYGCKPEDIKKLNPELPADGKIKAPTVVKIP